MSEEIASGLFNESTEMYREGNYEICLALLNDCILLEPARSILFSNRAIANFHLKEIAECFSDLNLSVRFNHLNYIAYFNLFSLHMVQDQNELAFTKLCLCLSSAYTYVCRHAKTEQSIERALYYCWNNKEAIFLKAMLRLEGYQLEEAMRFLKEAVELQTVADSKRKLIIILNQVEGCLRRQLTFLPKRFPTEDSFFELKTTLECPKPAVFLQKINSMLDEFNAIYQYINEQIQGWHYREIPAQDEKSTISIDNKSEANHSVNKDEKMFTCITANNSTSNLDTNLSENQKDQPFKNVGNFLFSSYKEEKELNIHSEMAEKHVESESDDLSLDKYKINSDDLYPLRYSNRRVRIYVSLAEIVFKDNKKRENLMSVYSLLTYNEAANLPKIRTSITRHHNNRCRWQEWSDTLDLTQKPSNVTFKIFNKNFKAYRDTLLGYGQFELNSIGAMKIPIYSVKGDCTGRIEFTVELQN